MISAFIAVLSGSLFAANPESPSLPPETSLSASTATVVELPPASDSELADTLARAEALYDEGLERFGQAKPWSGRRRIKKAFSLLSSALIDGDMAQQMRGHFDEMLEIVRTWDAEGQETGQQESAPADEPDEIEENESEGAPEEPKTVIDGKAYTIPIEPDNKIVRRYIDLYTGKRRGPFLKALERSGRYRDMILAELDKRGMPRELLWLVMAESEFKPHARSRAGASGLWQFMPFTGRRYGLKVNYWIDERYDPEKATPAALTYLQFLHQWFNDWHLAMAAYNRGEAGIGRDLNFSRALNYRTLSERGGLPRETRFYVPKIMACILIGENPEKYGFSPKYESPRAFDRVRLSKPLDLEVAARAAGVNLKEIRLLNPAIRSWSTPENARDFEFRVPKGRKESFLAKLAGIKNWNPGPKLIRYRVRRGDYIGKIARRYRTTIRRIMADNRIRNPRRLRPGQILKIRPGRAFAKKQKKRKTFSGKTRKYTVKRGDFLGKIANRFGTTVKRIRSLNGLGARETIFPGQTLTLPVQ